MADKYVIIFKNLTSGFMNLENINYLAKLFQNNEHLKEKIVFILDNDSSCNSNQALMQMFNSLMGFNLFIGAYSNNAILEYKQLNQFELGKKIEAVPCDLNEFIKNKLNYKIKTYIISTEIYKNLLPIIKEIINGSFS